MAYDFETLKEVKRVLISDKNSDFKAIAGFKDFRLLKAFATKEKVLLFLEKYSMREGEEVAVMELSPELKPIGSIKTDKSFVFIPEEYKEVAGKVYLVGLFDYNKKGTQVALFTIDKE